MPSSKSVSGNVDISTQPKRRRAVSLIIVELSYILYAEHEYMYRIPENLQSGPAFAAADYSSDCLIETILLLLSAYE